MLTWLLCMHMKDGHVQGQDKVSWGELNGFGKIKNSTMNKNHKFFIDGTRHDDTKLKFEIV